MYHNSPMAQLGHQVKRNIQLIHQVQRLCAMAQQSTCTQKQLEELTLLNNRIEQMLNPSQG